MTVRLHIERLVVEGFDLTSADLAGLQDAIVADLSARFAADPDAAWSGFAVPALALGSVAPPGGDSDRLGRAFAGALYAGLRT